MKIFDKSGLLKIACCSLFLLLDRTAGFCDGVSFKESLQARFSNMISEEAFEEIFPFACLLSESKDSNYVYYSSDGELVIPYSSPCPDSADSFEKDLKFFTEFVRLTDLDESGVVDSMEASNAVNVMQLGYKVKYLNDRNIRSKNRVLHDLGVTEAEYDSLVLEYKTILVKAGEDSISWLPNSKYTEKKTSILSNLALGVLLESCAVGYSALTSYVGKPQKWGVFYCCIAPLAANEAKNGFQAIAGISMFLGIGLYNIIHPNVDEDVSKDELFRNNIILWNGLALLAVGIESLIVDDTEDKSENMFVGACISNGAPGLGFNLAF